MCTASGRRARCCPTTLARRDDQAVVTEARQLTRQGEDRRAELLGHAEALFLDKGYGDTRMIDIARAAGVAKGLVYWYFESKETLFGEIIDDLRRRLRQAQADAVAGLDDPLQIVYRGTAASVRFVAEHSRLYAMMFDPMAQPGVREVMRRSHRTHARDTSAVLSEGQRRGVVRTDDSAAALAQGNTGVVSNYVAMFRAGALGDDLESVCHVAARYVVHAIAVDGTVACAAIAAGGTA